MVFEDIDINRLKHFAVFVNRNLVKNKVAFIILANYCSIIKSFGDFFFCFAFVLGLFFFLDTVEAITLAGAPNYT